MPYNLPVMTRRQGKRRSIALRPINPTAAQASELAAIIAPAWRIWASAKASILQGYDPAPISDGDTLVRDGIADIAAAINRAAAEFLTVLSVEITPALRRWSVRSEQLHRNRWIAAVQGGTGIDLTYVLTSQGKEETLAAFLERMTALVKDVSAQAQGKIADAVYRGYQQRVPLREVAKEIDAATSFGRARSLRIASHQNSALSAALDVDRQLEAGLDGFKYRHGGKVNFRPWHKAREGKVFDLRTGKQIGGTDEIKAGDGPGEPPGCSCRRQAWIPLMDGLD